MGHQISSPRTLWKSDWKKKCMILRIESSSVKCSSAHGHYSPKSTTGEDQTSQDSNMNWRGTHEAPPVTDEIQAFDAWRGREKHIALWAQTLEDCPIPMHIPVHRAAITETVKVILSYTVSMRLARETWPLWNLKKEEGRKEGGNQEDIDLEWDMWVGKPGI